MKNGKRYRNKAHYDKARKGMFANMGTASGSRRKSRSIASNTNDMKKKRESFEKEFPGGLANLKAKNIRDDHEAVEHYRERLESDQSLINTFTDPQYEDIIDHTNDLNKKLRNKNMDDLLPHEKELLVKIRAEWRKQNNKFGKLDWKIDRLQNEHLYGKNKDLWESFGKHIISVKGRNDPGEFIWWIKTKNSVNQTNVSQALKRKKFGPFDINEERNLESVTWYITIDKKV
jgi:hypothetical protein